PVAHVIDDIVDDRVITDLDSIALRQIAGLWVGAHIEADDDRVRRLGEDHVALVDPTDRRVQYPHCDLVGRQLFERADDRFERALYVGFDDDRQLLRDARGDLREHLLEGAARTGHGGRVAPAALTEVGDFAGAALALDHDEIVAGKRNAVKPQYLDRGRGSCLALALAALVDQSANPTPLAAGDEDVADVQRAALDQHGGHRAAAALACRIASTVCSMMPSSAATTRTTISVTLAPRARIAVKAWWPGVSIKVICLPPFSVTV